MSNPTKFKPLCALAACLVLQVFNAPAGGVVQSWVQRYDGPAHGNDMGVAIASDSNGNVYVAGASGNRRDGSFNGDCVVIKYASEGNVAWQRRDPLVDYYGVFPVGIAVDTHGSVLVTANSGGSAYIIPTIKYSSSGIPLWTNWLGGYVRAMALDASGNVFVAGHSEGSVDDWDYQTVKYSNNGLPLWTNHFNGRGDDLDYASAMAIAPNGDVLVTGSADSVKSVTGNGRRYDIATIKYSNDGIPLWTNIFHGPDDESSEAHTIAVDSNGNVIIAGYSGGYANVDTRNCLTLKLSASGSPVWTNYFDGSSHNADVALALAVDLAGNAYATGFSDGDCVTLKYSGAGDLVWSNYYAGPTTNFDRGNAIRLNAHGDVCVTGSSGIDAIRSEFLTVGYSSAGTPLWTNCYRGTFSAQRDGAIALTIDANGNVYVTGRSFGGSATWDDMVTIKYAPVLCLITDTALTGNQLRLSGNGGSAGSPYYVLSSTNPAAAMTSWLRMATNTFGPDGTFSVTNTLDPNRHCEFFRLETP